MIEKILAGRGDGVIILDMPALQAHFGATQTLAMDIETFGVDLLPGDSPFTQAHGIAGLAVANTDGKAVYILVDDSGGKRPGIPVAELAEYANRNWLCQGRVVVFHNAKFDLGFLSARGFDFSKVELFDTWILHSLLCRGAFVSNKLKDIVQARFKIAVHSEEILKKWLDDHKTMDYGEIPVELIGPYACDDVRYALALHLSLQASGIEAVIADQHRKFLDLNLRLIRAERAGIAVDVAALKKFIDAAREKMPFYETELRHLMKAVSVDVADDQAMLGWLHQQNLHPGRSDFFGEPKFYFDREALNRLNHPVVQHYRLYYVYKSFLEQWSALSWKGLKSRITKTGEDIVLHPSYLLSIFSKGGIVQCKKPDLHTVLMLTDAIRGVFKPKAGRHFVQAQAIDLPLLLLAYYCKDKAFQDLVAGTSGVALCEHFGGLTKLSPDTISLLFCQIINGYGDARQLERLHGVGQHVTKATLPGMKAKLVAGLPCINDFKKRLLSALEAEGGGCRDVVGSPIVISPDRRYRAPAILLSSGVGNILSLYLRQACVTAEAHGAELVFARENEFLFEAPAGSGFGQKLQDEVFGSKLVPVMPTWRIWDQERDGGVWRGLGADAHAFAADKLFTGGYTSAARSTAEVSGHE